jgi:hypothetical protein
VNIVRGIGKIFEFPINVNNIPEWINLYASIYHDTNIVNNAGDVTFEEKYSIFIERAAYKAVTENPEKLRKRKKRSRIF